MRCFVAVDISDEIKKSVVKLGHSIAAKADVSASAAKWVKPEAMHITLKFLGHIDDIASVNVCEAVREAATGHEAFSLAIERCGSFGPSSPRVLWVGTGQGSEQLGRLQQDVETNLERIGFKPEKRRFTGHLTLCRIKNFKAGRRIAAAAAQYADIELGVADIDRVTVYESRLSPAGATYLKVGQFELK